MAEKREHVKQRGGDLRLPSQDPFSVLVVGQRRPRYEFALKWSGRQWTVGSQSKPGIGFAFE